jgi:hypothetical protein
MPHYLSLIHELFAFLSFSLSFILQFLAHSPFLSFAVSLVLHCHSSFFVSFIQFYLSFIPHLEQWHTVYSVFNHLQFLVPEFLSPSVLV